MLLRGVERLLKKVRAFFAFNSEYHSHHNTGGCRVDKSYTGPHLPLSSSSTESSPTYTITPDFVSSMIDWFKSGKTLAKRYVWEIVLGAYDAFMKEESLVDVLLEEGRTCDVIGDVHGEL